MSDSSEKQRIEQLEAEVKQLKAALTARLDSQKDDGGSLGPAAARAKSEQRPVSEPIDAPSEAVIDALEAKYKKSPLSKAILVGVVVVALSLGIIYVIYSSLSKGLDNLAGKAARRFVPIEQQDPGMVKTAPIPPPKNAPAKTLQPGLRPPGL